MLDLQGFFLFDKSFLLAISLGKCVTTLKFSHGKCANKLKYSL